jgi:ABC-type Fe3+-hydroxamate transport system substrate-binding protein
MGNISRDQLGTVHHFDETPHRIISLVPSQTELLFDLGLDEEIIGITDYCIHPEEDCASKTKVGGPKSVDFAAVDALKPDLIIANKEENSREEIELLSGTYPVWVSDIYTLEDALDMIRGIGALVDRSAEAGDIVSRILTGIDNLAPLSAGVAYFIWKDPYMVAGSNTFIDEMLSLCGLSNVFGLLARYPAVTAEQINDARPDVIFLCSEPYEFTDAHIDEFEQTFPGAKAFLVDGEIFSWYGSRLQYAGDYFRALRARIQDRL